MSVFLMPKCVSHVISSIQHRFLWVGVSTEMKICKVAWHVVVRDKCRDCLGVVCKVKTRHCFSSGFGV